MNDTGLDEINETFELDNYYRLNDYIAAIQELYIENRIKWFWRRRLIRQFTAKKVVLMFSKPNTNIDSVTDKGFTISFTQKVMLVGKSILGASFIKKENY